MLIYRNKEYLAYVFVLNFINYYLKYISRLLSIKIKLSHRKVEFRDEKISLIFNFSSLLYAFHAKIIWAGNDNYLILQIYFG